MTLLRLFFLGVAAAALVGCGDRDTTPSSPRQVRATRAAPEQYQPSVQITGEVKARIQSDLSFRSGGRVTERRVDVGSRVRAGDVLARIDDTEQRADVIVARAGLQSAQAVVKQKSLAFERYKTLVQAAAVSQMTYDDAKKELSTAQGALATAEANLATAVDALSYTELKADADGVITSRNIEVGQVVSAAQSALTLAHDGLRDAVFNVFETFFLAGSTSDEVRIAPLTDRSRQARARIREVSPVIDTRAGTIRVKVTLPDDVPWALGTSVVGEFRSSPREGIVLPWTAMGSANGDPAVWIIDPANHTTSLHKVVVARYRTADFVVTGGISAQDLVVTEGGKFLKEDQKVAWENN